MKTKLLKRLRKEANMTYIHKGTHVYRWFNEDVNPNAGWGKGYNVIYDCVSEDQAKQVCESERRSHIKKIAFVMGYRKRPKAIRKHINERLNKTAIL